jgi:alkylation response protein AidB-like acyl-CoA dehydrogenase
MDVRLSAEQRALRDSAAQLVDALAPRAVAQLDDAERAAKLDAAVQTVGWRELRTGDGDDQPLASAVDAALVAEELGRGLADTSFFGPVLAADLRRLAGARPATSRETVLLTPGLSGLATSTAGALAIDAAGCAAALVLTGGPEEFELAVVGLSTPTTRVDLTRPLAAAAGAAPAPLRARPLGPERLARWEALALALTCADLVGAMHGTLRLACDYAKIRSQYGRPIGAFQAVQHLLADAYAGAEGARSVALHAAWAADALPAGEARAAAALAKAYCARAARDACETAIQVHGGIGNTWDCLAHLYLRRALLSSQVLGDAGASLEHVLAHHGIGGGDGLR